MEHKNIGRSVTAVALAAAFVLLAFVPFADDAQADPGEADYTFYRYSIKYFSTSQDAEFLIWDFADGTVLDGRWEYYAQLQNSGEELTPEQETGLEAYWELLNANGGSIYSPVHTYAAAGVYTYSITAINPLGYVSPSTGMPYDGAFSTDEDGFDGGLSAGITVSTYDGEDKTVSGSWDTAFVTLDVRGYPTVSFESNGGSEVEPLTVENTEVYAAATAPADPVREGYAFDGWYSDEELTAAYDWSAPVEVPITLYAKWTEAPADEITVTFNGIEYQFDADANLSLAQLTPYVPVPEGYTFAGWFADAGFTQPVSGDTILADGMVLFLKFDAVQIPVVIDGEEVSVASGKTVADLQVPAREGYSFTGWYADEACTQKLDADTVLTPGMHAYAGFAKNAEPEKGFDWAPVVVIIAGAIIAIIGIRFHPYILVAGAAVAAVGAVDFAGIIDIFGGLL